MNGQRTVRVSGIGGFFGPLVALVGLDEDLDTAVVMLPAETATPFLEDLYSGGYPIVGVPESACIDFSTAS